MEIEEIEEIKEENITKYNIKFSNGINAVYKGELDIENKRIPDGVTGAIEYPDGTIFKGMFYDGKLNGKGIIKYPDGIIFKGMFYDGEPDNEGVMEYPDGTIFKGMFYDGKLNGEGIIKYSNGTIFKGMFYDGKLNGKGVIKYSNGSKEIGFFKNSLLKEGRMEIKFSSEQPELCYSYYKDNKFTKLKYFNNENDQKYEIRINYDMINQFLNRDSIKDTGDLFKKNSEGLQAIIILDSKGNDVTSKKGSKFLKDSCVQIFKGKFEVIESSVGFEGSTIELNNLLLLINAIESKCLNRIRFSSRYNENSYKDMESFLNSFYITKDEEKSKNDPNFVYIGDLKGTDYFSTSTSLIGHALSLTVDLKKMIEFSDDTQSLHNKCCYGFDSERNIDDQGFYPILLKDNFEFYNYDQQRLGSCWFNSICSTIVFAENPRIINKIRNNEIKPVQFSDVEINDGTEFNELQILQMQKLLEVAKYNGFERVGLYEDKKQHKHQYQRANRQVISEKSRDIIKKKVKENYKYLRDNNYIPLIKGLEKEKIGFNTALNNYLIINNMMKIYNKNNKIQYSKKFHNSISLPNKRHSIIHNITPHNRTFLSDLLEKREKIENNENKQINI